LVGLLLPRGGGGFEAVARAVYAGVAAAHERDGADLIIEPIAVEDDAVALAKCFADLESRHCDLVLGPVTRKGVNALLDAGPLRVPTVALSQPDSDRTPGRRVALLGLAIESEAHQSAMHAMTELVDRDFEQRPRAAAVVASTALARRAALAFEAGWRAAGGEWRGAVEWGQVPVAQWSARWAKWSPDVVYAVVDGATMRRLRASLASSVMVWGTSLLNAGAKAAPQPDLDGIYVMEMPYHVELENPAVAAYPRASAALSAELQRLYALGIDAVRVGRAVLCGESAFDMDGLTGWLRYDAAVSPRVERRSVPALFKGGVPVALDAS